MKISDHLYDILAWVGRVVLPAVATLWVALSKAWGLPYTTEVATTIMAFDLFLNTLLGVSSNTYYANQGNDEKGLG